MADDKKDVSSGEKKTYDDDDDLFTSALETQPKNNGEEMASHGQSMFTGGDVNLNDDEDGDVNSDKKTSEEHEDAEKVEKPATTSVTKSEDYAVKPAILTSDEHKKPTQEKKEFSAMRRFSDFLGLPVTLYEKLLHLGRIVPPAPEKSVIDGDDVNLNDDEDGDVNSDKKTSEEHEDAEKVEKPATTSVTKSEDYAVKPAILTSDEHKKPTQEVDDGDDQFITISIRDPQKIGEGMSAYMAYKICTKTNLKYFKKKEFSAMRRFSDFLGLHVKLNEKHLHLGRIVPPAPEKSVIGMAKVKMSKNEEGNASSNEFIEHRRNALERYLNRTANHPVLRVDPDFREFLELDADLPRATSTAALSGAGMMRLFNKVGDTVNKITFKMDENNPWFEEKQLQIDNLDQQLRKLHASVEALVIHRKDLVCSSSNFAKSVAMLSNCEEHTSLSRALSQLAEIEEKIESLHQSQTDCDFYILSELIKDYVSLIGVIKQVFHQRVKIYQTWQHAQQMLTKKREQKAKLELAGKNDKIPQAREEVVEWEAKVERCQEEFETVSKMIRKEVERFEFNRVKDFKDTIIKYMESLLETQQKLVKYWDTFLPEAKAIA